MTMKTIGGIKLGINLGLLVDGDVTSVTAAKAAVDADAALLHVAERYFANRVKASIDMADNFQSGWSTGSDADAIYSIENEATQGASLHF